MSTHLPLIQQMFPKKLVLDINEIATLIDKTPAGIYSMIRDSTLPFKLIGTTRKIQALVVEIANYLDGLYEKQKPDVPEETIGEVAPKRIGRPRGSRTKPSPLLASFQTQLAFAVSQYKATSLIRELEVEVSEVSFPDDSRLCSVKYEELKSDFALALVEARRELNAFALNFTLEDLKDSGRPKFSKL